MQETDIMSELGEWKDCIAYPKYQISSTGAFMNKRTLKILKHFIHKDSDKPAVTLYRGGKGDVRDVDLMLKIHFGDHAFLPQVEYHHETRTCGATMHQWRTPSRMGPCRIVGRPSDRAVWDVCRWRTWAAKTLSSTKTT